MHGSSGRRSLLAGFGLLGLLGCGTWYPPDSPPASGENSALDARQLEAQREWEAQQLEAQREREAEELDTQQAARAERLATDPQHLEFERAASAIESELAVELRLLTEDELDQVLGYYCGDCHLPPATLGQAVSGMNYIDDLEKLIETGKVIPGDAEDSRLVQRMRRGEMPPAFTGDPPVPDFTLQLIVDFIDALPAPELRPE